MNPELLWGAGGFVLGAVVGSFFSSAGADLYALAKRSALRAITTEHEVEHDFKSTIYAEQHCAWIPEENLPNKEKHKWQYCPHPKLGGRCYRVLGNEKFPRKEYLMVTPNAQRV
jgi:hypothetical protein